MPKQSPPVRTRPRWKPGAGICACVVRVEGGVVTEEELRDWCAVTLAEYKLPDLVRFMDDLPLTGTGKVWRLELARLVGSDLPDSTSRVG